MSIAGSHLFMKTRRFIARVLNICPPQSRWQRRVAELRTACRAEDGAILVMTVLMLPVIIGFIGLMLDGGLAYAARRELQDAADGAALAGAMQVDMQYFSETGIWRIADTGNIPGAITAHVAAQQICGRYAATCTTEVLPDFNYRTFRVIAERDKNTVLIHLLTGNPTIALRAESTSVMVPGY